MTRYLRGTRDKGKILFPTGDFGVNCDVDEDWFGLWHVEANKNPICVKSGTEYKSKLFRSPLSWTSQHNSNIEPSTKKSTNIALSTAMRAHSQESVNSSVFDDNALILSPEHSKTKMELCN
jgi:hypothetical protein